MKKERIKRFVALGLSLASVTTITAGSVNIKEVYAAEVTQVTRPHFENGYVTIDNIKYHKISDTAVAVNKGLDYECSIITIPTQISVDGVRYTVTTIEGEAFKGEIIDDVKGTRKSYKATQIIIPTSIKTLGAECFYSLENIQSLDLSGLLGDNGTVIVYDAGYDSYDISSSLKFSPTAKIDRIKVPRIAYHRRYDIYTRCERIFSNNNFSPIVFKNAKGEIISQWYIKPEVRVNEVQDPEIKEGYTFAGWKQATQKADGYGNYDVPYTEYSPSYEEKQPLWDFEDKFKLNLANAILGKNSTQNDIDKIIKQSLTYDNITYEIKDFRNVPPEWDTKGAVRCTVKATNTLNSESISINVDRYTTSIIKLEVLKDIFKEIEVSPDTDVETLKEKIKDKLGDNGLEVEINDFENDGKKITGDVTVTDTTTGEKIEDDLYKVLPGKIEDVINDIINGTPINKETTQEDLIKYISSELKDPSIKPSIEDFKNEDGKVSGTVVIEDGNGGKVTIQINKETPERTQTVTDLKQALEDALNNLKVTEGTSEADINLAIKEVVKDPSITATIKDFKNDGGKISGTIVLKDVDTKEEEKIVIDNTSIDKIVKDTISDMPVGENTTDLDILNKIVDDLADRGLTGDVKDFDNNGKTITGTVTVTDGEGNVTEVPFTKEIVKQSVDEIKKIIQKNLIYFKPTDEATAEETIATLSKGIVDADADITIPDFTNTNGKMNGTITITKTDGTIGTLTLDKTVTVTGDSNSTTNGDNNATTNGNGNSTTNSNGNNSATNGNNSSNGNSPSNGSTNSPNSGSNNSPNSGTANSPNGGNNSSVNNYPSNGAGGSGNVTDSYNTTDSHAVSNSHNTTDSHAVSNSHNTTDSHDTTNTTSKDTNIDGDKNTISKSKDDNHVDVQNDADNSIEINNDIPIQPVFNISNCTINGNIGNISDIVGASNVNPNNSLSVQPNGVNPDSVFGASINTNTKSLKAQTGWQQDRDGLWYYLDPSNGTMKTGWFWYEGNWYYLKEVSDGTRGSMQTGWRKINGNWYYMYQDGKMAKNTIIDGYALDDSGKLI